MDVNSSIIPVEADNDNTTISKTFPFVKPTAASIVILFIYGFLCFAGSIGNGLVIYVISRYAKMKTNTNLYILNLAVADGLFLLGLPMIMATTVLRYWAFGFVMCKVYFILTCINMFTGAFTLTVMAGDRWLAVVYPIDSMKYRSMKYSLAAIAGTWLLSIAVMFPVIIYAKTEENSHYEGVYSCIIAWPEIYVKPQKAYVAYTLVLGFLLPVLLISILYIYILIRLRNTGPYSKRAEKKRSHRKVTKLVSLIIGVYISCWLPYWCFQLKLIIQESAQLMTWEIYLFQVFTILSYSNSMINPILYAFTNDNFRDAFLSAFKCMKELSDTAKESVLLKPTPPIDDRQNAPCEKTEIEFAALNEGDRDDAHDLILANNHEVDTKQISEQQSKEEIS